ncbi:MAG: tetratricopeptide repeat protein [Candidatus Schekmanbacteria bacterium]|nr:tetratricopeptide repeat protein [Candidatus Schekmanbacteria bacterium]
MMSKYCRDVTEESFATDVVERSFEAPVVVDFWAEWCGPCRTLGPMLERLAAEGQGRWLLAKVDVDRNQRLALQFRVQGIPAVKAFVNGQVRDELTGAQPESVVREFLNRLSPRAEDPNLKRAADLERAGRTGAALVQYEKAAEKPESAGKALLGAARCCLAERRVEQARQYLERIGPSDEAAGEKERLLRIVDLVDQARGAGSLQENRERVAANAKDWQARYNLALLLATSEHYQDALRHLLVIVQQQPAFADGAARRAMLSVFALLGDDDALTREYRSKLASALY